MRGTGALTATTAMTQKKIIEAAIHFEAHKAAQAGSGIFHGSIFTPLMNRSLACGSQVIDYGLSQLAISSSWAQLSSLRWK